MEEGPRLKIELTLLDKVLEIICLILLTVLWIGIIVFYAKLPDQIPSHFNAAGEADDHSNKSSILWLPIIATIIYVGMTLLNKRPHICNHPATVTAANAKQLYTTATRILRIVKLAIVIIFSGIVFMTYRIVFTNGDGLGAWFLPAALCLLLLTSVVVIP